MTNELPLVHRALAKAAVPIHTLQRVSAFDGSTLTLADVYSGAEKHLPCRSVVMVGMRKPRQELYDELLGRGAALEEAGIASVTALATRSLPEPSCTPSTADTALRASSK